MSMQRASFEWRCNKLGKGEEHWELYPVVKAVATKKLHIEVKAIVLVYPRAQHHTYKWQWLQTAQVDGKHIYSVDGWNKALLKLKYKRVSASQFTCGHEISFLFAECIVPFPLLSSLSSLPYWQAHCHKRIGTTSMILGQTRSSRIMNLSSRMMSLSFRTMTRSSRTIISSSWTVTNSSWTMQDITGTMTRNWQPPMVLRSPMASQIHSWSLSRPTRRAGMSRFSKVAATPPTSWFMANYVPGTDQSAWRRLHLHNYSASQTSSESTNRQGNRIQYPSPL